jgi:hypothetical protein
LIIEGNFRLQHVKPWNSSRFKTILLILQLLFQQIHGLLLHVDELSIDHYLVELRFHRRDELVQDVTEGEVGAVALKESAPDLVESCAVKNQLRSEDGDGVRYIAELNICSTCRCRRRVCQRRLGFPDLGRR